MIVGALESEYVSLPVVVTCTRNSFSFEPPMMPWSRNAN